MQYNRVYRNTVHLLVNYYAHSVSFPWQPVVAAHDSKRPATELQNSGSYWFEEKTILISMIQVRPSDPTISFKMDKEDFRQKFRLQ